MGGMAGMPGMTNEPIKTPTSRTGLPAGKSAPAEKGTPTPKRQPAQKGAPSMPNMPGMGKKK